MTTTVNAQPSTSKIGGISFRVDDNQSIAEWEEYAAIFNKYNYNFGFALNLSNIGNNAEWMNLIRDMQSRGHEFLDHTPNHITTHFTGVTDTSYYSGRPGVDHIRGDKISLKYDSIDTSSYVGEGLVDIIGDTVISHSPGEFADEWRIRYLYFPALGTISKPVRIYNSNESDPDTLLLRNFWNEDTNLGIHIATRYHKIGDYDVHMSIEARNLLAERTLIIAEDNNIFRPFTWIQPGGTFVKFVSQDLKETFGDNYGYVAGATYRGQGLHCYNEYDPTNDKRFGMQWGDFNEETWDFERLKRVIADRVARHYLSIGHSHFSGLRGGWSGYLERVDSLLAWAERNKDKILVRTYSEWATILYDIPQNPYVNIFPDLNTDLNEDNLPDGYYYVAGYTDGVFDSTDGVSESGYRSFALDRTGSICYVRQLAGLEKGYNDFSIWTKGSPGDSIIVTFAQDLAGEIAFKFPAENSDWTHYRLEDAVADDTSLFIREDVSIMDIRIKCSDCAGESVKVSGMKLHKRIPKNPMPPVLSDLPPVTFVEDEGLTLPISDLFDFVQDPDDSDWNLTWQVFDDDDVTAVFGADSVLFTSEPNWFGMDTLQVVVSDWILSDTTNLFVMITPVNDSPFISDLPDTISFTTDSTFTLALDDYVEDIDDPDSLLVWHAEFKNHGDSFLFFNILGDSVIEIFSGFKGIGEDTLMLAVTDTSGARDTAMIFIQVVLSEGIDDGFDVIPEKFELSQNYPNPFNLQTIIRFAVPKKSEVTLVIYNLRGQEVFRWGRQNAPPGYFVQMWDGTNKQGQPVTSGIYFYRLHAGDFVQTRKMVLLK